MNTLMKCRKAPLVMMALAGLIGSSALVAQETLDRKNLPRPGEDRSSCQDVEWNESLLLDYPWVMESCHEVIVMEGRKWARFEAQFDGMNRDGTFDVNFTNRAGREQGVVSLRPGANQTVLVDNREYRFSELSDSQQLSFYVPEGAYGFAVEPGVAPDELVAVVEPRTPVVETVQLARAEPRQTSRPTVLPATAGPLPLFGLGGLLAMLGGLGMTMRRRSAGAVD